MADVLEQFFGGSVAAPPKPTGGKTVASDVQTKRDQDALAIIQQELGAAQGRLASATDPQQKMMHQADIAALQREIARKSKTAIPATAAPAAQTTQAAPAAPNDPLEAFFTGKPIAAQPATVASTSNAGAGRGSYEGYSQAGEAGGKVKAAPITVQSAIDQPSTAVRQIFGNVLKKGFEARQQLGERTAGVIDTLYGVVPATYGAVTQAFARASQTPEQAEQTGQTAAAAVSQPVGKAAGITGKETYQQPLGGITQPIAEQINKMFNVLGMTPEQISEKTGIPAPDIRNMVVIGSVALPQAVKETGQVVGQVKPLISKAVQPLREMAKDIEIVRPGQLSKAEAQAQFEARQAPAGSAGAAAVEQNPFAGKITGEETARGNGVGAVFPQVKLTKIPKDVPVSEQQLRSQLFQEVLPDLKPRPGVVTGNDNLLRNEHGLANMAEPSPLGLKLKEQIANEQVGFSNYAQDRVNATGARSTFTNDEQRGNFINDVAHGVDRDDMSSSSLTGYLNQSKKEIYDSAHKNMGDNRINTNHADSFFGNAQQLATAEKDGTLGFLKGAQKELELAKTVGFELPDGKTAPAGSVASFNAVIKSNNASWTPERANTIRKINQAIDKDIAAVADPALYKLGDKIHQVEKTILGSNGFKRLFGEVGENGTVTSKVAPEKLLSSLNNLRKDEWRHIRDTFNELANGRVRGAPEGLPPVPPELRQSAAAAVAEMDGALAREVYKAGATNVGEWNSNAVNSKLTSIVGEKILETFPPDEIRKFGALNYVGQFTPGLKYEGAGQQTRRIGLLEKNYPAVGATLGSGLGAVIGETPLSKEAALGGFIGREAGAYLQTKKAAREEAKAVRKMEKEMEKAKALGQQTGKNKIQDLGK
jgi:Sec-independent protein translocase protein TatA